MKITMIKKQLANGEPCAKCVQAEELLRKRGVWDQMDEVVWAREGDADSPGMRLAAQWGVEVAPFFLVEKDGGTEVYTSALKLWREQLKQAAPGETSVKSLKKPIDWGDLAETYRSQEPQEILRWVLERYGATCAIAFSGAEDVVLIDMASRLGLPFSVFCLDTGRLHPETYHFVERVRKHYGIDIHLMSPKAEPLQAFVKEKGLFSFYEDGHKECCGVRKIEPLRRALGAYQAWVTGQRHDQSPSTRSDVPVLQEDTHFQGSADTLVKANPLAYWSSAQVWQYIRDHEVPYNVLHERGFVSIGCEPCTRPIRPNDHERVGRWWWEEATKRECGLHVGKDNNEL